MSPARPERGKRPAAPPRAPLAPAPQGPPANAWAWAAAVVVAAVLVFFYPLTLGKVFLSPDSVAPAGFSKFAMDALNQRHVYALWNPYHFLGMPSFGSLSFVPYVYPLDALFGFLNVTLHFPDLTWLLAHYLLLGLSTLALLKAFGAGPLPATLGAITFALTPNLVAVGAFGHGSQIMTAAYLPLILLLYDRFLRGGSLLALAGLALAAALQLLRGHVQVVFYTWLALGGYALVQGIAAARAGDRGRLVRAAAGLAAGLALGFGMSAFLYLPTRAYADLSIRSAGAGGGTGLEYATSWSFHPREMLTFVLPGMFGFGGPTYWGSMPFTDYPNYMGILPLALAVYGAWRTRGTLRTYLLLLAAFSLLVSFGKHFPLLYTLLYDHLPFFNKFRVPVMILVLVQFAVAVLAALGLEAALASDRGEAAKRRASPPRDRWLLAAGIAAAGGAVVMVLLSVLGPALERAAITGRFSNYDEQTALAYARQAVTMATGDALRGGLLLGAGLALVGLFRTRRVAWGVMAAGVLLVTAADLWVVDRRIIDPLVGSKEEYAGHFEETPEVKFLKADSTLFRVLPLQWNDSRLAAYGIASALGYHPAKPKLYQAFVDTVGIQSLPTLRFLNVKYMLTDGYVPPGVPDVTLRLDGPVKVYELTSTLPRAHVVHRVRLVRDESVALAVIRTNGYSPATEALWADAAPPPPVAEPSVPSTVRVLRYDFNECEYLVSTAAPGLLVVRDLWDPDWKATVDGKPATIHRVDYLLRGVAVGPGVQRVAFRYEPRALATGMKVSVASLAATLLLGLAGAAMRLRRRPARPGAPPPAAAGPEPGAGQGGAAR